jgi:hypothetical protein
MRKISEVFEDLNVKFVHLEPYELKEIYETIKRNNLDFEDAIHYKERGWGPCLSEAGRKPVSRISHA